MQSSLIGKIEKAKRYAQETDRVTFRELVVKFRGENSDYVVNFKDGKWHCTCSFFSKWGLCSHTMALEKILVNMLPPEARTAQMDAPGLKTEG
jgi:predicted nucleic acid-binding Zn finger protein